MLKVGIKEIGKLELSTDFVVVLDCSSSMLGDKLKTAFAFLDAFMLLLAERDRLSLILFNHEVVTHQFMRRCTDAIKAQALNFAKSCVANGGTAYYSAVQQLHEQLRSRKSLSHSTMVVFVSDLFYYNYW
jgi:uncharacterized protein with von Willebrand factor type A (vWA) domain